MQFVLWFELFSFCYFGALYSWLCGMNLVHCWTVFVCYLDFLKLIKLVSLIQYYLFHLVLFPLYYFFINKFWMHVWHLFSYSTIFTTFECEHKSSRNTAEQTIKGLWLQLVFLVWAFSKKTAMCRANKIVFSNWENVNDWIIHNIIVNHFIIIYI